MEIDFFWQNVLTLIKQQGKTKKSLSVECGLSDRRIDNLSIARRAPDVLEAYKIAHALGTSVEYLVTGEDMSESARKLETIKLKLQELQECL
jgi:transcriptional regulator with XRE-family HTH domain